MSDQEGKPLHEIFKEEAAAKVDRTLEIQIVHKGEHIGNVCCMKHRGPLSDDWFFLPKLGQVGIYPDAEKPEAGDSPTESMRKSVAAWVVKALNAYERAP